MLAEWSREGMRLEMWSLELPPSFNTRLLCKSGQDFSVCLRDKMVSKDQPRLQPSGASHYPEVCSSRSALSEFLTGFCCFHMYGKQATYTYLLSAPLCFWKRLWNRFLEHFDKFQIEVPNPDPGGLEGLISYVLTDFWLLTS